MTVGILIAQIVIFLVTAGIAAYSVYCERTVAGIFILIVGTIANVILSCIYGWCLLIAGLILIGIAGIFVSFLFIAGVPEIMALPPALCLMIAVGIFVCSGLVYLFNGTLNRTTEEIAYVEEKRINIVSSSDKGISDTSINGSSNLLFGNVTGTTTLTYYYSYYYQEEDGSIHIGTIPSNVTKLYMLTEAEQPYVKILTNHHKTINSFTGLPSDQINVGSSSYELHVPESAIPTDFTYNLN